MKKTHALLITLSFIGLSQALTASTTTELITKIHAQHQSIKDKQAYYIQSISSPLTSQNTPNEKGKLYQKGTSTRKEIQTPTRKLIITTKDYHYEKDLATGQAQTQKTENINNQSLLNQDILDPEKALELFDFEIQSESDTHYVLEGDYNNTTLEIEVNKSTFTTSKMSMIVDSKKVMTMQMSYALIQNIPVLTKATTQIDIPMGNTPQQLNITIEYKGIKINQNLSDTLFNIE